MEQKVYKVEEFHRGEWIALEAKDNLGKKLGQKTVKITAETAETMNIDSKVTRIRYVLDDEKKSGFDVKAIYKMSKGEQEDVAEKLGIEFTDEHSNQEKRADFLKSVIEAEIKE